MGDWSPWLIEPGSGSVRWVRPNGSTADQGEISCLWTLHQFEALYPSVDWETGTGWCCTISSELRVCCSSLEYRQRSRWEKLADFIFSGQVPDSSVPDLLGRQSDVLLAEFSAFSPPSCVVAFARELEGLDVSALRIAYGLAFPGRKSPEPNYYRDPALCGIEDFITQQVNEHYTFERQLAYEKEHGDIDNCFEEFYYRVAQWRYLVEQASVKSCGICFHYF